MTTIKIFLSKLEKDLFDLKKEVLKRNNDIDEVNTLIWMIDGMRNSVGEEMLKTLSTIPETPWKEIYEKTEYIWTYCNKCTWCGYVKKPKRDDPCPNCGTFDLKQRYVLVRIGCKDCGRIGYAAQGVLKCVKCKSKSVSVIQKRETLRTHCGKLDNETIKYKGSKPWPKDEEGNLIC
jgi:Zn finger protein HypA/HybF involved in hydrogenase expression